MRDPEPEKNPELAKMRETLEKFHPHSQAPHEDPKGTAMELSLASPKRIARPHISFLARRPAELAENADTKALVGDFLLNGQQRGYSQSTIRNYREDVGDFLDFIGSLPVVAVRPIHKNVSGSRGSSIEE